MRGKNIRMEKDSTICYFGIFNIFYTLIKSQINQRMGIIANKIKSIFEVPRYNAAFMAINLLLGTGPIIVPEPFFRAGIVFSSIWGLIILFLSYNSAIYIGESMQLIRRHEQGKKHSETLLTQNMSITSQLETSLIQGSFSKYDHITQFKILYGQKWKYFPGIIISIYLFGVSISKCIMTSKTLSKLFTDVQLLDRFQFWLGLFFISGAAFSFKSISKTKPIQIITIIVRLLAIFLMILGAIIIIFQNNFQMDFTPTNGSALLNADYLGDIFSNLVFSYMFHHSIPTITQTLRKPSQIKQFLTTGFTFAGIVMFVIPITAIMAFGNDLVNENTGYLGSSHSLKYYSQDFKGRLNFIYYIVSFYLFLNVTAFSVYIIVIRQNVFGVLFPSIEPNKVSKPTLAFSAILLVIILSISYLLRNQIQIALSFTAGIFGMIILFGLPCMEVYKARKLFPPQKSFLNSYVWMPLLIMGIGLAFMCTQVYEIVSNLLK